MENNKGEPKKSNLPVEDPLDKFTKRVSSGENFEYLKSSVSQPGYSTKEEMNVFGQSKHDKPLTEQYFQQQEGDKSKPFQYQRGAEQSYLDKAANGTLRLAGRAITSGTEGLLTPFVGTFMAIKDGKFSSFYDNPVSKTLDSADKGVKEAFGLYDTRESEEAHGLDKLKYANTLFGDVFDGIGYSLGSIATGGVYSKIASAIAKTALVGKTGDMLSKLNSIENAQDKLKYIDQVNKLNKVKDGLSNGTIAFVGATAESSANARSDANEFEQNMINELTNHGQRELTDSEKAYIKQLKEKVGNNSFMFNIPTIMLDNWITFGKSVFSNKLTDKASLGAIESNLSREGLDAYTLAKQSSIDKILDKTYGARKVLTPLAVEGTQEQQQYAITKGTNDFYRKKYYNPNSADFMESLAKGLSEAYGTQEGWDNFIIGGLSGGLFGNVTTAVTQGTQGFVDQNKGIEDIALDHINSLSTKETYNTLIQSAMRHGNIMDAQAKAIKENDDFEYENTKSDAMINYALTRIQTGKLQDLYTELEQFKSMSPEDIKSTFGTELGTNEITRMKNTVGEFVESKIKLAKNVERATNIIDERFPQVDPNIKERLTYAALSIENSRQRIDKLSKEANKLIMDNVIQNPSLHTSLAIPYSSLTEPTAKELYKENLKNSEVSPMDQTEALVKFDAIDKLQIREKQFVEDYKALTDPKVQEELSKKDKEVEQQIKDIHQPKETQEEEYQPEPDDEVFKNLQTQHSDLDKSKEEAINEVTINPDIKDKVEILNDINITHKEATEALNEQKKPIEEARDKKEDVKLNVGDGIVPDMSVKERHALEEHIKESLTFTTEDGKEVSPQGSIVTVGDLIVPAANAIAYLSKNYEERLAKNAGTTYRSLNDVSDELNSQMQEPLLLSPNYYQPGEELTLEIDKAFNIIKDDKSVISYDQFKDDPNLVPIKITNKDGKTIGYLHTMDWINSTNVANPDNNIEKQRALLKELRGEVFSKGKKTTTITNKTIGRLSKTIKGEDKLTSELIHNPKLQFVIGKDNQFWTGLETTLTGNQPLNKNIKAGMVYMIAPTPIAGKTIALPVFNTLVTDNIANTLANAVDTFFKQDKKIADKVYTKTGIDILTTNGLRQFFNLYVSTNDFTQADLNLNTGKDNKLFLDVVGNGIKYGTGGDNLRDVGAPSYWNKDEFLYYIKKAHVSIFLKHMDKPSHKVAIITNDGDVVGEETTYTEFIKKHTTTNIVEHKLGEGEYAYFVQPVITFGLENKQSEAINEIEKPVERIKESKVGNKPTTLGNINLDDIDLESDLPPSLTAKQLNSITEKSSLIQGFTASKQAQVLGIMNSYILKELKAKGEQNTTKLYDDLKEEFQQYANYYNNPENFKTEVAQTKARKLANEFERIISNYGAFRLQSQARLTKFNIKETKTGDSLGIEDLESNNEKTSFDDGATFQIDSKEGMSSRLKQFLSFIPSTKKSYLGLEAYMPYDEVVNYLSGQLAGLDASYEDVGAKLEELGTNLPWIATVKLQLDNAPEQVRNEFVQWATKHYTGFKIAMLIPGPKGKDYTVKIIDSDQNSVIKLIQAKWLNELKTSSLVKETTTGNLVIISEVRKQLVEEIKALDKTNLEGIKNWLSKMGIDVKVETLEYIKNSDRLPFDQQFTNANGIFKTIIDNLSKDTIDKDDSFETNNPLTNNSGIRKLAKAESLQSEVYFSNSFKNGEGKTIYSYSANKYFINQFYKLKKNKDNYLENLLKISFSSTSSWGKKLTNPNSYFKQVFDYFYIDTLTNKGNSKDKPLDAMSSREHEITKLGLFHNQNNGSKDKGLISHFLFPTMSDKSTMTGITALRHNIQVRFEGSEYTIGEDTINAVYDIVQAEYKRIRASYDIVNAVDGYNPTKFYFFEELNYMDGLWVEEGNHKTLKPLTSDIEANIKDMINSHIKELVRLKKEHWSDLGLTNAEGIKFADKSYIAGVKASLNAESKTPNNIITYSAIDYVTNYLIANANAFQLFIGDPAQFAKKTLDATWINIGKRLAGEIAPGLELADSKNNKYTQAFIQDNTGKLRISSNIEQIEALLGKEGASPYKDIDSTDAQEWTTLAEHLYVLEKSGKISNSQSKLLLAKEGMGTLTTEDYNLIFQPIKPVYVNTQLEPSMDLNRKIYIKSSSFPLIKGLSAELDKLRQQMINQKVDRLAVKTATKVGGPKNFTNIFNDLGAIKDDIIFETLILDRSGFRIQQEVPFDESKESINRGTQESKLLFANILGVEGFEYDGKTMNGRTLAQKYNELNKELFANAKAQLFRELDWNGETFDIKKVQDMLVQEASSRGWPQNDIDALRLVPVDKFTETFELPLWASTSSNRIEALLNSLVDNRVRKHKFRGNSFVLASEEGFSGKSKDIIFTKSYDPDKGLQPQREVDGKVLPAQILIPNKLRDKNGKLIDIRDIGIENIDPDLLKIFGFRIPTQGHNSMTYAEIVGFLPGNTDIVVGPKDWTKQMGSDFDVDKLYSYMYNAELVDGKLQKYKFDEKSVEELYKEKEDEAATNLIGAMNPKWAEYLNDDLETFKYKFKQKELQNKLLDIHLSVMSNDNPEMLRQILQPLGFGDLPSIAETIDKSREKRLREGKFRPSRLSDQYQKEKYLKARAGKTLTGIKSLNVVFIAISQDRNLYLRTLDQENNEVPVDLVFGDENGKFLSRNSISDIDSVDKHKTKLSTAVAYQNAAVDNEKEQILEKINSNAYTVDTELAFSAVGFTENFIAPLTAQDIIFDYTDEMSRMQDSVNEEYVSKPEAAVVRKLTEKYATEGGISNDILEQLKDPNYPLTQKEMWEAIKKGPEDPNYYKTQIRALYKFDFARTIGKEMSNIQLSVNTDSAGISPSLIESVAKEEKVDRLDSNKYVANAVNLLDNTINGYATDDALRTANKLWARLFPYKSRRVLDTFEELRMITGKERLSTDDMYQMFNSMKSFIYTKPSLGLDEDNITSVRQRLFFDKPTNKSLATRIKDIQKTSKNPFILRLITEIDPIGVKPSLVKYNAGAGENLDELSVYQGFTDLFNSENTREIAQDLITYFYVSGGIQQAIQFGKYIPNAYLTSIPFAKELRNLSFNNEQLLGIIDTKENYYDVSNFAKQWIQHNPGKAIRLKEDLSQISNIKRDTKKNVTNFSIDVTKNDDILVTRNNPQTGKAVQVLPEFVNLNFKLYQYTGNGQYSQIDALGSFGFLEYNQNERNVKSLIVENQTSAQTTTDTTMDESADNTQEVENNQTPIDRVSTYKLEEGIEVTLNVIASISKNPLHKELATQYLRNLVSYPIVNTKVTDDYVAGSYSYSSNTISINPEHINSDNEFERAVLHELIHHLTGHTIMSDSKTPEQERIVNSLKALQKVLKDKIASSPAHQAEYEKFVENFKNKKDISEYQISKYYGAMDLREFVTMAMTDMNFQKILNDLPFSGEKTILDRFLELVNSILSSLGFPVKDNSVLKAAVENITELINLTNNEYVQETMNLTNSSTINIYAGTGENAELSNFAYRPFTSDLGRFNTVEAAFQYAKAMFTDESIDNSEVELKIVNSKTGAEAKALGRRLKGLKTSEWDKVSSKIMKELLKQSFKQNPEALVKLLSTGNAELTHVQDKGKWGKEFPKLLMEVRKELSSPNEKYELPNGKVITFNDQQSQAIKDINNFLKSDNKFYTLSGFAGTGKTTIIKSILDKYKGRVAVSAPTHKAKKVISRATKKASYTIQALLGLQPNTDLENFNINKPQFDPKATKQISAYSLIVLDEASMLNKDLFKMLTEEAAKYGTKIIFMGDEAQLPPVNEAISDVFSSDKISGISKLSKVERQAGDNPLMSIYDKIRNNITSSEDTFEHSSAFNDKNEGIIFTSDAKVFEDKAIQLFNSAEYKEDKDFVKLLTWTNADVKHWNNIIRKSIFGTGIAPVVKGDLLMAYNTVTKSQGENLIENSSDYEVLEVKDGISGHNIPVFNVTLSNIDTEGYPEYISIVKEEGKEAFLVKFNELLNTALRLKGRAWVDYFNFKKQHLLLEDIKGPNGNLIVKKDLDYGYAITTHKSQGSTYTNVLVNENNIDNNPNSEERNKLKYVAFSRPTTLVYALSQKTTGKIISTESAMPVSNNELPELTPC